MHILTQNELMTISVSFLELESSFRHTSLVDKVINLDLGERVVTGNYVNEIVDSYFSFGVSGNPPKNVKVELESL